MATDEWADIYIKYLEDRGFSTVTMDSFIEEISVDLDADAQKAVDDHFEIFFEIFFFVKFTLHCAQVFRYYLF